MRSLAALAEEFEVYGRLGCESRMVQFMLEHGRMFQRGTPPPRRGGWFRSVRNCFRNAYLNVATDPTRYTYCEGFCWSEEPGSVLASPLKHAWFIDRQQPNVAIDTTWKRDEEYQYFGMSIAWRYVCRAVLAEDGHASVLDYWERRKQSKRLFKEEAHGISRRSTRCACR